MLRSRTAAVSVNSLPGRRRRPRGSADTNSARLGVVNRRIHPTWDRRPECHLVIGAASGWPFRVRLDREICLEGLREVWRIASDEAILQKIPLLRTFLPLREAFPHAKKYACGNDYDRCGGSFRHKCVCRWESVMSFSTRRSSSDHRVPRDESGTKFHSGSQLRNEKCRVE